MTLLAREMAKTASKWVSAGGLLATLTWFSVYEFAQKNKPESAYLFDEQTALMLDSAREIAGILCLSIKTIETHRQQLMGKLNIHSLAELTKYALREGLTSLET